MVPDGIVTDYDAIHVWGLKKMDLQKFRCVKKKHIKGVCREGGGHTGSKVQLAGCCRDSCQDCWAEPLPCLVHTVKVPNRAAVVVCTMAMNCNKSRLS
jgi:hypothetical protein